MTISEADESEKQKAFERSILDTCYFRELLTQNCFSLLFRAGQYLIVSAFFTQVFRHSFYSNPNKTSEATSMKNLITQLENNFKNSQSLL